MKNSNGSVNLFHHSSWLNVLKNSYGFDVKVINSQSSVINSQLSVSNQMLNFNGIPFVIKKSSRKVRYISLPFSDYVSLPHSVEENDMIISKILNSNPEVEIEIRDKYEGNGFESKLVGYKHLLLLSMSEEELFNSFKKTQVQQPIQKSSRDGLTSEIRVDYKSVLKFYQLHLLTRKKLGVPIQPKKFFYHFWNEIINKKMGYVVLVYLKDIIISSGVFAGFNKVLTYKFSASNPGYLNYRPNNLMLWTAIQEAKRRGFEVFDFGRTDLETEGLRKFKLGWGTVEEPLYYSYYPKIPDDSKFKFVKDKIVAPIIKYSPKFVCRLSGELLYKYFG